MHHKKVFNSHRETRAAEEFKRRLTENFHWDCHVLVDNEKVTLG